MVLAAGEIGEIRSIRGGTNGRIVLSPAFLSPAAEAATFTVVQGGKSRVEQFEPVNQYALQVDDFGRVVQGLLQQRFTSEDAVANMRVIDACLRSARQRTRVLLEETGAY